MESQLGRNRVTYLRGYLCFVSAKKYSSGKVWNFAASQWVIGRSAWGCKYLPFSGLKNSVLIVSEGLFHSSLPNTSALPVFLLIQHGVHKSGRLLIKSNLFPPGGISLYLSRESAVGFLPKCILHSIKPRQCQSYRFPRIVLLHGRISSDFQTQLQLASLHFHHFDALLSLLFLYLWHRHK